MIILEEEKNISPGKKLSLWQISIEGNFWVQVELWDWALVLD